MATKKPRYVKTELALTSGNIAVYAGTHVREALREVTMDMDLFRGVKLAEVMQAAYEQGQRDGRKEMIEKIDGIKTGVIYLAPGRPKSAKKKKKRK